MRCETSFGRWNAGYKTLENVFKPSKRRSLCKSKAADYYKKNGKGKKAEIEGVLLTNVKIFQVLHRSNRYSRASGIRMWDMSLTKKFLCERFRLVGIVNLC